MGRTYEDYQAYMAQNPDTLVSQMDSVVIHKGGQTPIDLFVKIYGQEAAERLGLKKIPSDSIHLTPALFKK